MFLQQQQQNAIANRYLIIETRCNTILQHVNVVCSMYVINMKGLNDGWMIFAKI